MFSSQTRLILAIAVALMPFRSGAAGDLHPVAARVAVDDALEGQDLDHPPPGSASDQALWRSGHEITLAVHVERARSTRLQTVLQAVRYVERAQALGRRAGEAGAKARALEDGLHDAHSGLVSLLTARWPIDTYRVCAYPAMELGSMLSYGASDPSLLARHRAMLVGCVEQAQAAVSAMKNGNDLLEQAMWAVDAASRASEVGDALVAAPAAAPPMIAPAAGTATPAAPLRTAAAERAEAHQGRDRERDHERTSRDEER